MSKLLGHDQTGLGLTSVWVLEVFSIATHLYILVLYKSHTALEWPGEAVKRKCLCQCLSRVEWNAPLGNTGFRNDAFVGDLVSSLSGVGVSETPYSRFRRQDTNLYQAAEGYLDKFDKNPSSLFVFNDGP